MGLYIRDDTVRDLATKLATQEGCTITDAVRRAIEDKLHQHAMEHDERWRVLREIQARLAELPDLRPGFTDQDLYDEAGLPIL